MPPQQEAAQRQDLELPGWLDAVWRALDADEDLSSALTAYYEALQLDAEHPSAAFVLYVTVIEGIGAGQVDLAKCLHRGAEKGAAKRFRVMGRKEADVLETAYGRRSRTAHVGALHGAERTLGYLPDSDFRIDETLRFEEDELAAIHQAARAVLIHALDSMVTR